MNSPGFSSSIPPMLRNLRVAIVHYWFTAYAGGERVTETLAGMFPQADLFALVAKDDVLSTALKQHRLTTSFLQKVPGAVRWYRHFLPLYPLAIEQLDLSGYDLILSCESGPAKGVISHAESCHICYCLSPMRYIWDLYPSYRASLGPVVGSVFSLAAHYVRLWDLACASRVDAFSAISDAVASRVQKHYRRPAEVIYPPVDVSKGILSSTIEDYYLVVSRLVDYKRIDLAIKACNQLSRPLRVIGEGPEYKRLRALAGPTVKFMGRLDDQSVRENYSHCRALLFPGEEDFGIVPVEAQSFGRPVVAYGRGGARETITSFRSAGRLQPEISTGLFFDLQTPESLVAAMLEFESAETRFTPAFIRSNAEKFDIPRFQSEMYDFIQRQLSQRGNAHRTGSLVESMRVNL